MSEKSLIEWTHTVNEDGTIMPGSTWNPIGGCERLSPGCTFCYAVPLVWRMAHNPNDKIRAANEGLVERLPNGKLNWTGVIRPLPDRLTVPFTWKKPRRIFVNSLSDMFHPDVPFDFIDQVFAVMALCPQHTFIVLTKRPERMAEYTLDLTLSRLCAASEALVGRVKTDWFLRIDLKLPLPNCWLGTSTENQETYDERVPWLRKCPAAIHFLSIEPLLGRIDPTPPEYRGTCVNNDNWLADISWCIVGGESGAGARPMHPEWARELRDRCINRKDMGRPWPLPFFFKQNGVFRAAEDIGRSEGEGHYCDATRRFCGPGEGVAYQRVSKKAAGRLLDGIEWSQFPREEMK